MREFTLGPLRVSRSAPSGRQLVGQAANLTFVSHRRLLWAEHSPIVMYYYSTIRLILGRWKAESTFALQLVCGPCPKLRIAVIFVKIIETWTQFNVSTIVAYRVLDKQHHEIHNEHVAELRWNPILLKSIACFRSSRPHSDCISFTDFHDFMPKKFAVYSAGIHASTHARHCINGFVDHALLEQMT